MKHNYTKIATVFSTLDLFLFALLGFLFKAPLVFVAIFVIKLVIHLAMVRKEALKPVLIFDGILALLPISAIVIPLFIHLFIQAGNTFVISWVVLIFGIYASPMTLVYGGISLTFGALSLKDKYTQTIDESNNE
ncbi:hypothetical protein BAU15_01090 [Enterococcus sp. JM4C]|uniref:hypothetical protein n=1 Tax=Candidatus Enterococcus huntleyi TaxID=1857217 RepID=UPI00137B1966|nr:hypothetical protein [Enterococcus sp. JM4C]KAF1299271.1 hypothetical protein BAU15_01090 [Enterococcus sp. JM4C]